MATEFVLYCCALAALTLTLVGCVASCSARPAGPSVCYGAHAALTGIWFGAFLDVGLAASCYWSFMDWRALHFQGASPRLTVALSQLSHLEEEDTSRPPPSYQMA